ncbi:MAG: ABC transporter ATP-binding protein [Gammaproteobacteria bacterium]
MDPLLSTQNLTISINNTKVTKSLDLEVQRGQCWGILGQNGIGKSTLLKTIAGLREADSGDIKIDGKMIKTENTVAHAKNIGVLFQEYHDAFPGTVLETALTGRHPYLKPWQWETKSDFDIAQQALELMGLQSLADRSIKTLSGGERQRLEIAMVLTQDPELFLLDEPTNHLDLRHQIIILDLLKSLCGTKNKTAIMILHDVNLVNRYCDHVLLLYGNGDTEHGTKAEKLNPERLSVLYGHPISEFQQSKKKIYLPS